MRRVIPVLLTVLLLLLSACSPADGFEEGRPISKEELESISAALFGETGEPADTAPLLTDREPNTYYWTKSGRVYHKYRDCPYLKNAKEIESGGLISAESQGRESPCSLCCND
jgi:hypothetical protein